jgi:PAS domain S-box-containing protein
MSEADAGSPDFRALFEASPDLYLILDPTPRIVAVNDAYCRATMTVREQIVGRLLFDVFPDNPDDPAATGVSNLSASLEQVLTTRQPHTMALQRYDIARPEGGAFEERFWSVVNRPVLDASGAVRWIIHRAEDATERVRMDADRQQSERTIAALRESSGFFDTVIENIPAMIVVKDATDLRFVLVNRTGEEWTGIPRSEWLGKTDFDLFPRAEAELFVARDRQVLSSRTVHAVYEQTLTTRTRGVRSISTHKMPVFGEDGQPRYLLVMSNDVTESKRAAAALRSSEARFGSLMSTSPDAVMAIDGEGKIVLANERFRTTFGYEPGELIGMQAALLTPPEALEENTARLQKSLETPSVGGAQVVADLEGLRKDGTVFPTEAAVSEHMTEDGPILLMAIRDVTGRKAIEGQLRQAMKMEAIGNLTGGMAHDFNNLLSVVIGNLDLLREQLERGTPPDELASEALQAALRGAELTNRLLAFARRQPLQPKVIDVNQLIEGVHRLLDRTLGANVEISLRLDGDLWPVVVDPVQFEACLVNLAANARDAMPRGGKLQIVTANRHLDEDYAGIHPGLAAGDYAMVEVGDTGSGIAPEIVDKIFEPFFTTKQEGRGTGLGLSMVFGFMKQSNGHINVYSEPGVGTTFRLYLPRSAIAAERARSPGATPFALGEAETILAVEDNPKLRALVVRQLSQLGYRCLEAEDGPSALKVLETHKVHLLFSDVIMPGGMSGYELGRAAMSRWPKLKVLLTSGFPEEKINGNGQPPWNMRLLLKPYRKEELALLLRQVLAEGNETASPN